MPTPQAVFAQSDLARENAYLRQRNRAQLQDDVASALGAEAERLRQIVERLHGRTPANRPNPLSGGSIAAMLKSEVRAEDYRDKARNAAALADASVLEHVRAKHALAAAMWTGLADSESIPRPAPGALKGTGR